MSISTSTPDASTNPTSFEFRVIRYEPDVRRGERVNIGLLVKKPVGLEVVLHNDMSKALAISPQVSFPASFPPCQNDLLHLPSLV